MKKTEKKSKLKPTQMEACKSMPPSCFNKTKEPIRRIKDSLPLVLILAGFLLISFVFMIRLYTDHQKEQLLDAYKNTLSDLSTIESNANSNNQDKLSEPGIPDTIKIIGLLTIPKIDLVIPVGEEVSDLTMQYTVAHFENTVLPGQIGNCAIAGHRNYLWGEYFNRLDELEVNDTIILSDSQKTYTYTIMDKLIVNPEDVWVLDQTADPQITLITCTPIRIATQRLIIRGTLSQVQ